MGASTQTLGSWNTKNRATNAEDLSQEGHLLVEHAEQTKLKSSTTVDVKRALRVSSDQLALLLHQAVCPFR